MKAQTIVISNFTGRLTRILNGDLNSGFARFSTSWGYDPFSKPMNLTWFYSPTDIASTVITDAVLATKTVSTTADEQDVYGIGNAGYFYKISPVTQGNAILDTPSILSNVGSITGAFNYGSDMDFYNSNFQVTSDTRITTINSAGSVLASSSVTGSRAHPLVQFQGSLYTGNGNNLMKMDTTGLIVNGAVLSPALPTGMFIRDLDVTPDGTYMLITASYLSPENLSAPSGGAAFFQSYSVESYLFLWNGTDAGVTSYETLPAFPARALNTFLNTRYTFNQDTFGMGVYEAGKKLITLQNNLAPMPNGVTPNGTFLTWMSPEATGSVSTSDTTYDDSYSSLYYFGVLDNENPAGLWRVMRLSPSASREAYRSPVNMTVNAFSPNLDTVVGWGKHYLSVWESNGSSNTYHFYRWLLPPAAGTVPLLGVYETQTQLFSKKVSISQIRVYTEPTVTGNAFQLDIIGADGSAITNGTFTYTFASGSDETKLQGALERINFEPACKTLYAIGVRVTNTGTTNMTFKKIELDISEEGK